MNIFNNNLHETDKDIDEIIKHEKIRQSSVIELIASENFISPAVLEAQGSILTNKYAEGYPSKRFYNGCEEVDKAENLAIERAKKLFNCKYANVQPHSGSQANQAVYLALLQPGDTILGMSLDSGGHLTHLSFIEDIPKKPTIIVANEFFDAMPIKQYIKVKELWYERIFVVQPVDGRIKYDKISVNKQLQEYLLQTHIEAKDGAVLEESYKSIEIIKFIAQHLKKLSGSCLIIDYGYDIALSNRNRYQYNPTLQAVKNHKYCPILENCGKADLSAHVDFYTLKTVAKNSKINVINTILQRDFLIENGILLRSKTLQDKLNNEQAQIIEKQVERLISPKQMGVLFKVLQIMN